MSKNVILFTWPSGKKGNSNGKHGNSLENLYILTPNIPSFKSMWCEIFDWKCTYGFVTKLNEIFRPKHVSQFWVNKTDSYVEVSFI